MYKSSISRIAFHRRPFQQRASTMPISGLRSPSMASMRLKTTQQRGFTEQAKKKAAEESSEQAGSGTHQQSKSGSASAKFSIPFGSLKGKLFNNNIVKEVKDGVQQAKHEIIDAQAYRYGGITSKAYRERIKAARMAGFQKDDKENVQENPEAGANVVLHKDSRWKEAWNSFRDSNPVVQGVFNMRRRVEETDNFLVNTGRVLADRFRDIFGPMFEESEHAQTLAEIREIDPTFKVEEFVKEARELMIPEILEAYIEWNKETLQLWCSDAVVSVLEASREPYEQELMTIEGKLLDLRNVELVMAKMMEDTPLLILSFKTQQIEVVRNKNGEIVSGDPDKVNDVFYIFAVTKDAERPNPLTRGWKVAELAIQGVRESI